MAKVKHQKGFSLIELLMVVVIVGILAAIGVPSLSRSRDAAERGAIVGVLRTMHTDQTTYLSQQGRYARLNELNAYFQDAFGTTSGSRIVRGNYLFLMSPNPTLTSLRTRYQVLTLKNTSGLYTISYQLDQDGEIIAINP